MQGFNMGRYVPPEYEGTTSANKLAGKHALGNRARKAGQGILTVRFEMPFPIWCTTCSKPTIIGQGVRFNAEKEKVGNYYTTPIFSFRMKHNVCGGWIEIRTDPKNTAYVVTEGAKKRDTGEDKIHEGEIVIKTDEERQRLKDDAFAALEVKIDDRKQATTDRSRIEDLQLAKEKDWDDPYAASRKLRRAFRADRKSRQKKDELTKDLRDRMSLGIELLEETEDDRKRARLVEFGELGGEVEITKAKARPLFDQPSGMQITASRCVETSKKTRALREAEGRREKLGQDLRDNTRAANDPFLNGSEATTSPVTLPPIKRKRKAEYVSNNDSSPSRKSADVVSSKLTLVDYDSD